MSINLKWMVLGSSRSAEHFHLTPQVDCIVSAGDAILLQRPDYYCISEESSLDTQPEAQIEARYYGTKVVIMGQMLPKLEREGKRPMLWPFPHDISIWFDHLYAAKVWHLWKPGTYVDSMSGAFALQFAANHKPSEIHVVGMEGYVGSGDYFISGQKSAKVGYAVSSTRYQYGKLIQRIVDLCPDTDFTFYGDLNYPVDGFNVSKVPCPRETVTL